MIDTNLLAIFLTGLLAGGVSCLAVQGGLLASIVTTTKADALAEQKKSSLLPIVLFVLTKLVIYTLLGGLLGWVGSKIAISLQAQVILQFAVVIFMIGTALNLLNVHPIFRYFVIQPPHFLTRLIRKQSKRHDFFAPIFLGVFTVFIPCGATQAIMALAVASGSPIAGAAMLFAFVLGTSPLFLLLGYFAMRVGDLLRDRFAKVAAFFLLLIAVFNFNGALALTGTTYTPERFVRSVFCLLSYCSPEKYTAPVTEQIITITPRGYSPSNFTVTAGSQVQLKLYNEGAVGCQQAFTIPSLGIHKIVQPGTVETITFTAPSKTEQLSFMCSMGMYPGTIQVL